ncbi:hypothetical protein AAG570_012714 [Ranatra chinensis]|uniref:Uncharacterized protein n=1 Tax=Ranatra chinensis TaxID=642074 RepID=A0ABD0YEM9_9HEMI
MLGNRRTAAKTTTGFFPFYFATGFKWRLVSSIKLVSDAMRITQFLKPSRPVSLDDQGQHFPQSLQPLLSSPGTPENKTMSRPLLDAAYRAGLLDIPCLLTTSTNTLIPKV